jgi:hypothetical protein
MTHIFGPGFINSLHPQWMKMPKTNFGDDKNIKNSFSTSRIAAISADIADILEVGKGHT